MKLLTYTFALAFTLLATSAAQPKIGSKVVIQADGGDSTNLTEHSVLTIGQAGSGAGAIDLFDADGSHSATLTAAPVTTTSLNIIFPAAPYNGLLAGVVSSVTNFTLGAPTSTTEYATGGSATFIVAAVDAPTRMRAQADYQCDGVADDVQINAAITAAYATGGRVVLTPGFFTNSAAISMTNGVALEGWGSDGYLFDVFGTTRHRSKIVAATAGMTMVLATPSTGLLSRPLVGLRIRGIEFDGAGIANIGVKVESAYQPLIEDVAVMYCTNHLMWLGAYSNTNYTGLIHTYQPFLKNVILDSRTTNAAMASCHGLTLEGDDVNSYVGNGSTTLGTFINLSITHGNGNGINLQHGDHHTFINPTLSRATGGTGYGVYLGDAAAGKHPADHNTFIGGYVGAGGVIAKAAQAQASAYNMWKMYSLADEATPPIVETGAIFAYEALDKMAYRIGWTQVPWMLTNNTAPQLQWRKAPQVWEFAAANGEWTSIAVNSGTGTSGSNFPSGNDVGAIACSTSTSTNAVAGFRAASGNLYFNSASVGLHWRIHTPSALSTDADGYEIIAGFGDVTTDANVTDGVYFRYTHSLSNGVWVPFTANNSVTNMASGASSTVTVAINTVYDLIIEVTSSVANFWVSTDNGATYTWLGYITSTIPQAAGRETAIEAYIRKLGGSVGTTARIMYLGRCELWPN